MRCRSVLGFTLGLGLLAAPPGLAAAPQIKDIAPSGVRRGEPAEVVISGANR